MKTRKLYCKITLSVLVFASASICWAKPKINPKTKVGDDTSTHLVNAVKQYITKQANGVEVSFYKTAEQLGKKRFILELARQLDKSTDSVLRGTEFQAVFSYNSDYPELRKFAMEHASHHGLGFATSRAMVWLAANQDLLNDEQTHRARRLILRRFKATKGKKSLWSLRKIATAKDIPFIRQVYDQNLAKSNRKGRSKESAFVSLRLRDSAASNVLLLLAQLGERRANRRIARALTQKKNIMKRAWALLAIHEIGKPKWLAKIVPLIDDQRVIPAWFSEWQVAKKPRPRRLEQAHQRIADLAVEVGYDLIKNDGKGKKNLTLGKWSFKPWGPFYNTYDLGNPGDAYPFQKQLSTKWSEQRDYFIRTHVFGYTDDQLEEAKTLFGYTLERNDDIRGGEGGERRK